MAILRYIFGGIVALMLTSCYEDFNPGIDVEPVLCMNSLITAGEPIEVKVSHTWLYNDTAGSNNHSVPDAKVSVFVDDELRDASYIPKEGDRIRLVAESKTYGRAEAEVTVPYAVPIDTVRIMPYVTQCFEDCSDSYCMVDFNFNSVGELQFNDIPGRDDYYVFTFTTYYPGKENRFPVDGSDGGGRPDVFFSSGYFDFSVEPVFGEHTDSFDSVSGDYYSSMGFFTDRQFSGKTYSLHLRFTDGRYFALSGGTLTGDNADALSVTSDTDYFDCGYEFYLYSVSKSYYLWCVYSWQENEGTLGSVADLGLGDELMGYSNVSTGAGIVAARSVSKYRVDMGPFIRRTVEENKTEY